ncbi:MAG: GAF domain-containing sensor histidine kinase [Actinomycetota bacterium]|nr:GAF domain-containing sensor histidine kinase [Actinomycetota bacterium]
MGVTTGQRDRLRALVQAGIALTSELSLDGVLQKLVETAAELTGARYAALGVISEGGDALERFVFTGVDEESAAQIGELPRGRGILGILIRDARPLRLDNLGSDPRSVGFPPHHPPMRSFLGVPILLRGAAYGNLYLTEKEAGRFTEEDEELVQLLAAQAAVAIENTRLYEATTRWSRQLESLTEIGTALAAEIELPRLLDLIAQRLRELVRARIVGIAIPADGALRIAAADGPRVTDVVGLRVPLHGSKMGRVFQRRRSERVDSLADDPEADHDTARRLGIRTGLYVPLLARERAIGVVFAGDKDERDGRFSQDDLRLAEIFAARASVAVDLSERVSRDALRRIVQAQELERHRLARELHDETGQALTSILLGLKTIEEARDREAMREATQEVRERVVTTLQDVRRLAVELRPKVLDDFGLVSALERLTETFQEQTGLSVDLEAGTAGERLPGEIETALYRIVQEALTNVVKHARATRVSVLLTRRDGSIAVVVEDDGLGFEPADAGDGGFGLVGIRERIELLGGRLGLESSRGTGTTLVAEVPL